MVYNPTDVLCEMVNKREAFGKRKNDRRGIFIVVDGLDGIGKGEVERALIEYEQKCGKAVFDSVAFSKACSKGLPELADFWSPPNVHYNTIVTAEPTYAGVGHQIRGELIERNGRNYSPKTHIQAYSLDRLIQMTRVVIPALQSGLNVIQSRCCASTLCYQQLEGQEVDVDPQRVRRSILAEEGNRLQLRWTPDLLIIPTIDDVAKVVERIQARRATQKDDKSIFDNIEFQGRLKPLYESAWLRGIFEGAGTKVAYLNAGLSVADSRAQAVEIYKSFIENNGMIPAKYQSPKF